MYSADPTGGVDSKAAKWFECSSEDDGGVGILRGGGDNVCWLEDNSR